MRPTLETERLRLRPLREDDLDAYAALYADPDVVRYLEGRVLSRDEAWRNLALVVGHWELRGFGLWAVEERESGEMVGRIGHWQPEGWPGFEIGWLLARSRWGLGYATEGARAALADAFVRLGRDSVISVIHPDNAASIRVAGRIGERFERRATVRGFDVEIHRIDRAAWERGAAEAPRTGPCP